MSPIIVALINRGFDCTLQKQRMLQERFDKYYAREAELFDSYLRQTAVVDQDRTAESSLLLVEYYYALLPYLSAEKAKSLKKYTLDVADGKKLTPDDIAAFNTLVYQFKQSLDPQQRKLTWSKWRKEWRYKD